jgi:TRAP-type uncharacterized transport system substrate-binding protein
MSRAGWRLRPGRFALAFGCLALAAALYLAARGEQPAASHVRLSAGEIGTTRFLVASALARELKRHGVEVEVVAARNTEVEFAEVDDGSVDFGLVSGAFRIEAFANVRQVAPLYVEALHLLVKQEVVDPVDASLAGLRGRSIDLGPDHSATAGLAAAVLDFAGLRSRDQDGAGGFVRRSHSPGEIESLVAQGDRDALPDAIFHLATVPSIVAERLIREGGYRIEPLPFADAFRLSSLLEVTPPTGAAAEIERPFVVDTLIPAFAYGTDPASPPGPLHTIGTRLLLVANKGVSPETVSRFLDAAFASRFAHVVEPPLDHALLHLPPRLALHEGTLDYKNRDKSVITEDSVANLSNTLSVVGAFVGGTIFLLSAWRQRRQARTDELFGSYMLRVAEVARKAVELELSASIELGPLMALQRDLLELQGEALERFAAGELGNRATLSNLLAPLNAAREHVGELLLHVRQNIEERADEEGRTPRALWLEAVAKATKPGA